MGGEDYVWQHHFEKPREDVTQADVAWLLFDYFKREGFWTAESNAVLSKRLLELFGTDPWADQ